MCEIITIKTLTELKEVFNFISKVFYEDAKEHNEFYYTMAERFEEMKKQLEVDNELLIYIKEDNKIVAALTGKGMDKNTSKITLGTLAVDKNYRKKGYAKKLIKEFENRCSNKGIHHIELGSRFRACELYKNLGYYYSIMVQVFDFTTIEDVRKFNIFNLEEISSWQGDTYGFIFYKINDIDEKYIKHFEENVPTAHVQYIFEKDI